MQPPITSDLPSKKSLFNGSVVRGSYYGGTVRTGIGCTMIA